MQMLLDQHGILIDTMCGWLASSTVAVASRYDTVTGFFCPKAKRQYHKSNEV